MYLFMRDTERGRGTGRGKRSRLYAGSPMRDSIPGPRDHDLSQRQTLNHWATQVPPGCHVNGKVWAAFLPLCPRVNELALEGRCFLKTLEEDKMLPQLALRKDSNFHPQNYCLCWSETTWSHAYPPVTLPLAGGLSLSRNSPKSGLKYLEPPKQKEVLKMSSWEASRIRPDGSGKWLW